jgi:hypothetical protein
MKIFAIPFGIDGMAGDSSWHPHTIDATEQDTFDTLKTKLIKLIEDPDSDFGWMHDDPKDGEIEPIINELAGFWIIDSKTAKTIEKIDAKADLGSDSALYRHIHMLKTMVQELAIRTLSKE